MPQRDEVVGQVGGRPPGATDSRPRRPPPAARRRQPATHSRAGCGGRNGLHFARKAVTPGPACLLAGGRTQRHRNTASARRDRRTWERRRRGHLPAGRHPPGCGAVAAVGARLVLGRWPWPPGCGGAVGTCWGAATPPAAVRSRQSGPRGCRAGGRRPYEHRHRSSHCRLGGRARVIVRSLRCPPQAAASPSRVVGRGVGRRDQPRRRRRRGGRPAALAPPPPAPQPPRSELTDESKALGHPLPPSVRPVRKGRK